MCMSLLWHPAMNVTFIVILYFDLLWQNKISSSSSSSGAEKNESFGANCTNLNEDRPIDAATKMWANDSSFRKYKVYADARGGSSWRGPQMTVGLLRTIFGNWSGYFFGNFRDKASNII